MGEVILKSEHLCKDFGITHVGPNGYRFRCFVVVGCWRKPFVPASRLMRNG
jgi:hypothetical protein